LLDPASRELQGRARQFAEKVAGDLVEAGELDVVGVEDVDVVEPQAGEALVDAAGDAGGGEVEALVLVAAALGGDDDLVPRDGRVAEAVAEDGLRDRAAVVPARRRAERGAGQRWSGEGGGEARPRGGCLVQRMYGEVSKKLTPRSSARRTAARAASRGTSPKTLPSGEAPKPTALTRRPVPPSSRSSMAGF